ncbi:MAG: hypothetical protein RMJ15_03735 [Nitrososphaerota archaeon]|nr:hypothetical protein [Nitrososphaerota archaeon]
MKIDKFLIPDEDIKYEEWHRKNHVCVILLEIESLKVSPEFLRKKY